MNDPPAQCRCVVCHDYGDRDEHDKRDLDAINNVYEYGWGVIMVPQDDQGPGWAYTIGLWHSHRTAELAMFGLPDVYVMKSCLNDLAGRVAGGHPSAAGQVHHDVIERYPVHLKPIDQRWMKAFFGRAIRFYRRPPVPFLQVVWPDRDGRFSWETDSSPGLQQQQPQLWRQPNDHPSGVWTQDL